jgi:ATP-binding cassette subfamily B protein
MRLIKSRLTLFDNLLNVWNIIDSNKKKHFFCLIFLSIITSFFEVIGIGSLLPFLSVLANSDAFFNNPHLHNYFLLVGLKSSSQLLLPFTVIFIIASITAGVMRSLLLWFTTQFTFKTCAEISADIFYRTIHQPYSVHISRNSSEVINAVVNQANKFVYEVILAIMLLINSLIMISIILGALVLFDPTLAIGMILTVSIIYGVLLIFAKRKISENNKVLEGKYSDLIKSVQEGLGSIRDIIIARSQTTHFQIYQALNNPLRTIQAQNTFIANAPRYLIEALGLSLIAIIALYLIKFKSIDLALVLPFFGVMVISAQRLMPLFQQSYASWTSIIGAQETLEIIVSYLKQPINLSLGEQVCINFSDHIIFNKISFRYSEDSKLVLKDVNLVINKGSRIGIIGKTGSGKSTLVDILMGLISPTSGSFIVDKAEITCMNIQSWQRHISHVPQTIYLSDSSIKENIAFGVPIESIDINRVKYAAKQAELSLFIESLSDGYNTNVGERGVRFSGGQRQRIGIARALYKEADVIIFDEATNGLDHKTEEDILDTINNLSINYTIFIITHRVSTLKKCTKVFEINNGEIKAIKNYDAI